MLLEDIIKITKTMKKINCFQQQCHIIDEFNSILYFSEERLRY